MKLKEEALTRSEFEVLELVALRLTNKEIAEKRFVTVSTIKMHIGNIRSKIGPRTRAELGVYFREKLKEGIL